MGRGKRRLQLSPLTRADARHNVPLSDGARRRLPSETGFDFSLPRPATAIKTHAQLIAGRLKDDDGEGWDEAAQVLGRYRDHLKPTRERPLVPPALETVLNAALESVSDDGDHDYIEGYARRYFALLGVIPAKTKAAAYGLKAEGKVHLVDPQDPSRSCCGHLTRITARQQAYRGHWVAALSAEVAGRRACKDCRAHDLSDQEDAHFSVLEHDDAFPPTRRTEGVKVVGDIKAGLVAAAGLEPTGEELRDAGREALAHSLGEVAAVRLALAEWEDLRRLHFNTRLRLGQFYREAYGPGGERATPPSAAEWQAVLAEVPAEAALVRSFGEGMIFYPDDWRHHYEDLADYYVVPGLLAHCFPEMLAVIEQELEGRRHVLHGLSADYYERLTARLDRVWRRADRLRQEHVAST